MKKSLIAAALIAGSAMATSAFAVDGQVQFTGALTEDACELVTGTNPIDVQLGTYAVTSINGAAGEKTTPVDFAIELQNCASSLVGQAVYAKFSGTRDTTNRDLLAITPGSAEGVGIELGDDGGNLVELNSTSPATTFTIAADSTASLNYNARYVSTAAGAGVKAGDANAVADFDIMYP